MNFIGLAARALTAAACLGGAFAFAAGGVQPIKEIFEPAGNFPADKFMKVAVVQWAPPMAELVKTSKEAEVFKQRNRGLLEEQIREAAGQGAKFIISSELGVVGYPDIPELPDEDDNFRTREEILPYAEKVPGPSTKYFSKLAKELGVIIQFGLVEKAGENLHNTAVAIDASGKVIGKHRKVELYHQEADYLTPGTSGTVYNSPVGKVGMLICADVYTSSVLNEYRDKKVDAMALSTSWAVQNSGWNSFTSAAREVNAYILAANQPYFPDSGVAEPSGRAQSHIRQTRTGIAYGYLPLKEMKRRSK